MSSTQARRKLSFAEQPYHGTTFYLDIKATSLKQRISERIQLLGGQVESFLSRDISLLITDNVAKTGQGKDGAKGPALSTISNNQPNIPLSRGQALLLKASKQHNPDHGSSQDLASVTRGLGVKTETAATFLRSSAKHLAKSKSHGKALGKTNDPMLDMAPLSWEKEKEALCVLKVEDSDHLYRPLFKQFDAPPKISYNETGSPFDVGVVLVKPTCTENNQKKYAGAAVRGGYCESCDHWFKTTLREHLKSDKHKEFVSKIENFKSLESVATSLPKIGDFLCKHSLDPQSNISHQDLDITNKANDLNNNFINRLSVSSDFQSTTNMMTANLPSCPARGDRAEQMEVDGQVPTTSELSLAAMPGVVGEHKSAAVCDVEMMSPLVHQQMQNVNIANQSTPLNLNQISNPTSNMRQKLKCISIQDKAVVTPIGESLPVQELVKCNINGTDNFGKHDDEQKHVTSENKENIDIKITETEENILHVPVFCSESDSSRTCSYTPILEYGKPEESNKLTVCDNGGNQHTWLDIDHQAKVTKNYIKTCSDLSGLVPDICFSSSGSSCSFGEKGVANVISFLQKDTSSHSSTGKVTETMLSRTDYGTAAVNCLDNIREDHNSVEGQIMKTNSAAGVFLSVDDLQQEDIGNVAGTSTQPDTASDGKASENTNIQYGMCIGNGRDIFDPQCTDNNTLEKPLTVTANLSVQGEMLDTKLSSAVGAITDTLYTPSKHSLTTNYPSNVFHSGSTVRNWLLPPDQETNAVMVQDCLDNTLIADNNLSALNLADGPSAPAAVPTQNYDFVAEWIDQQPFCTANLSDNNNSKNDSVPLNANVNLQSGSNSDVGANFTRLSDTNKSQSIASNAESTNMSSSDQNPVRNTPDNHSTTDPHVHVGNNRITGIVPNESHGIRSLDGVAPTVTEATDDYWINSSSGISDSIIDYPPNYTETNTFDFHNTQSEGTCGMSDNFIEVGEPCGNTSKAPSKGTLNPTTSSLDSAVNVKQNGSITHAIDRLLNDNIVGANNFDHNLPSLSSSHGNTMDVMTSKTDNQLKNTSETAIFSDGQRSNTPCTSETVPYNTRTDLQKNSDIFQSDSNSATTSNSSVLGSDKTSAKSKTTKQKPKRKTTTIVRKSTAQPAGASDVLGQQVGTENRSMPSPRPGAMSPLCHTVVMQQAHMYSPISQASDNLPLHRPTPPPPAGNAPAQMYTSHSDSRDPQHAVAGLGDGWGNVNMHQSHHSQYSGYGNQSLQQYSNTQYQSSQAYPPMEQNYFDTGILPINNPYNQYYDSPELMLTQELLQSAANCSPHAQLLAKNLYGQSHVQTFNDFTSTYDATNNKMYASCGPFTSQNHLQYSPSANVHQFQNQEAHVPSFLSPTSNFVLENQSPTHQGSQTGQEPVQPILYSNWFPSSPAYHHSRSNETFQTIQQADIAEDLTVLGSTANTLPRNVKKPARKGKKAAQSTGETLNRSLANSYINGQNNMFAQSNQTNSLCTFDAYSYMRVPSPGSSQLHPYNSHDATDATSNYGHLHQGTSNFAAQSLTNAHQTFSSHSSASMQQTQSTDSGQQKTYLENSPHMQYIDNGKQTGSPYMDTKQQMPYNQNQQHVQYLHNGVQSTDTENKYVSPSVNTLGVSLQSSRGPSFIDSQLSDQSSDKSSAIYKAAVTDTAVSSANHCTYHSAKTGDTKLKLCKVPNSSKSRKDVPLQQKGDLKSFWNVRKAGDCRLVFTTQKRKAEDENPMVAERTNHLPAHGHMSDDPRSWGSFSSGMDGCQPHVKRQRCFVY